MHIFLLNDCFPQLQTHSGWGESITKSRTDSGSGSISNSLAPVGGGCAAESEMGAPTCGFYRLRPNRRGILSTLFLLKLVRVLQRLEKLWLDE